ncbi:acyltransferase-domain-containing protein [Radiomyces spectabilis]|uniref:acyltransferase-domain-containing protein n=1 Tax=Radiomyces spectabilis TaxID=64574 RepID=UPI0022202B21|nr:acyltransferase-domain-containing protein [Radiomyces spectabilis]KAI8376511.1 acyltransferase-domain-containing protein [Radiomyces spectabilis]
MRAVSAITEAVRTVFYGVTLFGMAGTLQVVQLSSFVLSPFSTRWVVRINSHLVGVVWKTMQFIFERVQKGKVTFSGDPIPDHESALVISNHRSWTDFYMLHSVAIRRHMLHNCKYFVKDSIKWLPFFGWGMWLAGFLFVKRNWLQDQRKIQKTFDGIKKLQTPAWIINYVEGSRFTPQKLQECQEFSRGRGWPIMENVLVPRTKGFVTCVKEFRGSHVEFVYDFTIVYRHRATNAVFNEAPTMIRVHAKSLDPEYDFHVNVKRFAIKDLPTDDEGLARWLRERYLEKDKFLAKMKSHWTDGLGEKVWEESF